MIYYIPPPIYMAVVKFLIQEKLLSEAMLNNSSKSLIHDPDRAPNPELKINYLTWWRFS